MAKEQSNGVAAETTSTEALGDSPIQGFSTKDGEIVSRSGQAAAPAGQAAAAPKAAVKAKVAGDDDEAGEQGNDGNRHKSAQARIDRAVGRQREAERERDSLRASNQALESRLAAIESRLNGGGQPQKPAKGGNGDTAPQVTDYEFGELDAAYIRDLARYEARQEFAAQQDNVRQQNTSQEQQRRNEEFQEKANTFRDAGIDKYDDFEELVLDSALPISPVLAELLFESDHGIDIAYSLAQDLKEAKRVSALPPARQAAWFGRKEAEYSSGSTGASDDDTGHEPALTQKTTQAPPPPRTRTRGSGGQQQVSAATSDFAAFERMAAKQQ